MSKTKVGHISSFFLYNFVVNGAHKSLATYIKLLKKICFNPESCIKIEMVVYFKVTRTTQHGFYFLINIFYSPGIPRKPICYRYIQNSY